MNGLLLFNRQRTRRVNLALLRSFCRAALGELIPEGEGDYQIAVYLVDEAEIGRLNEKFLHHQGSTDVITLDHRGRAQEGPLSAEIFISLDEALRQARRYGTTWQSEIARYFIHGALHLLGRDDARPGLRRAMKRQEDRLLKELSRRFDWGKLEREQ